MILNKPPWALLFKKEKRGFMISFLHLTFLHLPLWGGGEKVVLANIQIKKEDVILYSFYFSKSGFD